MERAVLWSATGFAFGVLIGMISFLPMPLKMDGEILLLLFTLAAFFCGWLIGFHARVRYVVGQIDGLRKQGKR